MSVAETKGSDWKNSLSFSNWLLRGAITAALIVWVRVLYLAPLDNPAVDVNFGPGGRIDAAGIELGLMAFSLMLLALASGLWFGVRWRR